MFDILDLVVAPADALLSHARVIGIFPLSLVPLFIGPPMGILMHVYSLRNLAGTAEAVAGEQAATYREVHA